MKGWTSTTRSKVELPATTAGNPGIKTARMISSPRNSCLRPLLQALILPRAFAGAFDNELDRADEEFESLLNRCRISDYHPELAHVPNIAPSSVIMSIDPRNPRCAQATLRLLLTTTRRERRSGDLRLKLPHIAQQLTQVVDFAAPRVRYTNPAVGSLDWAEANLNVQFGRGGGEFNARLYPEVPG
jgi:hypothetical protein